ncbi:unnamed protein product [Moneuplotes crassus]|uniref:GYF domain-containing protein n=1 Tax=Euplotes crassus TaxID=5936 RepID=A0AAD1XJA8_EUPCR|nr:unnamed protein product [Moneuplotes crassus]
MDLPPNINERQNKEAQEDRVDYDQVDEEVVHDVVNQRHDQDEDDADFRMNLDKADQKFRVKRKKKYLYTEDGIKIEPFKMDSSMVQNNGGIILMREEKKDSDEDDPWLESIKEQQEEMLKAQARRQVDSDEEYESSDNDKGGSDKDEEDNEFQTPQRIDIREIVSLKKQLIEYLEPKENVKAALKRLGSKSDGNQFQRIQTKKKNVRKRKKVNEEEEVAVTEETDNSENQKKFHHIMKIAQRLLTLKYSDVYVDDKESIQFDIKQSELKIKRVLEQKDLQISGWFYQLSTPDSSSEAKTFGPFKPAQMEAWRNQGYFKETSDKICSFKLGKDLKDDKIEWKFISEITKF